MRSCNCSTATRFSTDLAESRPGTSRRRWRPARQADQSTPENRGALPRHVWHRALADVDLDAGESKAAVRHEEAVIADTVIEG